MVGMKGLLIAATLLFGSSTAAPALHDRQYATPCRKTKVAIM